MSRIFNPNEMRAMATPSRCEYEIRQALLQAADQAEELAKLRDVAGRLYALCSYHAKPGAFANGVTDSTGLIDEGEVWAGRTLDLAREALKMECE